MTKAKRFKLRDYISKRNGPDIVMLFLMAILMIVGIVILFSASYPISYQLENGDSFKYVKYQAMFFLAGAVIMYLISYIDYKFLSKFVFLIVFLTLILLIVPLVLPGDDQGVKRWIPLGPVSFQPSELAKFALIVFCAHLYSLKESNRKKFVSAILIPGFLLALFSLMLLFEPHYSAIIILFIMFWIMTIVCEVDKKWVALITTTAVIGITALVFIARSGGEHSFLSYFADRLKGWTRALDDNLDTDMYWATWQTRNSIYAIGSGGLNGLGFGQSRHKYQYMPAAQNDFVFSIACEELGFVGALFILLLFAVFIGRCFYISLKAPDRFGITLGMGLSAMIGVQVIINILVITDWLPNTGISLPFFSYGGSFTMIFMAQLGVLLSISRSARIEH